jgi:hypothetical protein
MTNPVEDGVTHINVYTKGATDLGRFLTNMSHTPFDYTDRHGTTFKLLNVEQYWYYMKLKDLVQGADILQLDSIFKLNGFQAKKFGQAMQKNYNLHDSHVDLNQFRLDILRCIQAKILAYPEFARMLADSTLPFKHYYVYAGRVTELPQYDWILKGIVIIKEYLIKKFQSV